MTATHTYPMPTVSFDLTTSAPLRLEESMTEERFTEECVLERAREAYEQGSARFEVVARQSALLVIDMQDEFVRPGWTPFWVPEATRQVPRLQGLMSTCWEAGVPVIFTVFSATHRYLDRPGSGPHMPNRYAELPSDPE